MWASLLQQAQCPKADSSVRRNRKWCSHYEEVPTSSLNKRKGQFCHLQRSPLYPLTKVAVLPPFVALFHPVHATESESPSREGASASSPSLPPSWFWSHSLFPLWSHEIILLFPQRAARDKLQLPLPQIYYLQLAAQKRAFHTETATESLAKLVKTIRRKK